VQHDFAIWGGDDGDHVLDFMGALRIPSAVTLHNVPLEPTPRQNAILADLAAIAAATVVMSKAAGTRLIGDYGVDARRLSVIPHGVPDIPFVEPDTIKPAVGVAGREVLLSFGLLRPDKGLELAIDALPAVVAAHPTVLYAIVGVTHPDVRATDGEAYRQSLVARVGRLGLERHVQFVDKFVGHVELTRWLEAADVVLTPYPDLGQTTAGTLAYAMSAGRPVVSTPFSYASELLAGGRGVVLAPGADAQAMAAVVDSLLAEPERRVAIGQRAHAYSRGMIWSCVAAEYGALFERIAGAGVTGSDAAAARASSASAVVPARI
jgi:glycosyltransferase involved in cell wall biosynthesis